MPIVKIKENVKIGENLIKSSTIYSLPDKIWFVNDYLHCGSTGNYIGDIPVKNGDDVKNVEICITPEEIIEYELEETKRLEAEQQAKVQAEREQKIRDEYEKKLKHLQKRYDDLWKEFCPF